MVLAVTLPALLLLVTGSVCLVRKLCGEKETPPVEDAFEEKEKEIARKELGRERVDTASACNKGSERQDRSLPVRGRRGQGRELQGPRHSRLGARLRSAGLNPCAWLQRALDCWTEATGSRITSRIGMIP